MKPLFTGLFLLLAVFLGSVSLSAQEPTVKLYLGDGSFKTFNLSELQNISITKNNSNSIMKIYYQNAVKLSQPISDIDSIKFEGTQSNFTDLVIYLSGSPKKNYLLSEIDSINFFIPDAKSPQITNINPSALKIGDETVITGKNFGNTQSTSYVSFGSINAFSYLNWSDTEIKVKTPDGAINGKLSISVNDEKSNEVNYTIIEVPVLKVIAINPKTSNAGDIVSISGIKFGAAQGQSFVSFNSIKGSEYISWNDTLIKVKVPVDAVSGKLSVTVNNTKSNDIDYIINGTTALLIANISPAAFNAGNLVTITGTGFDATQKTSYVSFNNKNASEYSSWSNTEIKVKVPIGTKTGKIFVGVGSKKSNEVDYQILPVITKVTPDSAVKTQEITITGLYFGDNKNTSNVSFNGGNGTDIVSWSDTLIILTVPNNALSGKLSVIVNSNKSNEVNFFVKPYLVSVSPKAAFIGDEITLKGSSFGNSQDSNYVSINSLKITTCNSWSDSIITLTVPETSENGKITVTIANLKSNDMNFSILPKLISVSPTSARFGTTITLTGLSFGDVRSSNYVSFNNISATEYTSWSATSIVVKVPPEARTGKITVNVNKNNSNELDFTVFPSITSIYPLNGLVGDQVTINGASFGVAQGTNFVSFNGVHVVNYLSWTDSLIVVKVPPNSSTGKLSVTIGADVSNEFDFVVKANITSISPDSAPIYAEITISGDNFGDTRGTSFVKFNGSSDCSYQSWSNNTIVVTVPKTARTGKLSVSVSSVLSNEVDFTATTVIINNVEWMVRNLDVTTYQNGDEIPQVSQSDWSSTKTGGWCYYNNDESTNSAYGKLYNWYAVNDSRGLAPSGYHVASDAEWTAMVNDQGGFSSAGGPLKESGTTHWSTPNTSATNNSGFTGLPGGIISITGQFQGLNSHGVFWTSTPDQLDNCWSFYLLSSSAAVTRGANPKTAGFHVRCVKN